MDEPLSVEEIVELPMFAYVRELCRESVNGISIGIFHEMFDSYYYDEVPEEK